MADYAVQALRGKTSSVIAWMLDDNSHETFSWGAWANSQEGLKLRPWFYTWSLLCRYLPPGSTVYRPVGNPKPARPAQIRVLAARSPKGEWTFCVVNREKARTASVLFRVPEGPEAELTLKRYLYSEAKRPADERGLPVPVSTENADLAKGVVVECPADSAVGVTSVTIANGNEGAPKGDTDE
jgi:hypothetical protein